MTLPAAPANPSPPAPFTPAPFAPLTISVSAEQKFQLLEYWRSIKKRKWLILGLALVVALLAAVVALAITPIYRSTATVLIEAGKGKILSIEDIYAGTQQREHYQTQVEVLKSRQVAARTVRALKLWDHPLYDPRKAEDSWRDKLAGLLGNNTQKTDWTEQELADKVTGRLMADISIEPVRLSQLVKVSAESPDPKLAATLANRLSQEYIDDDRDVRFGLSQGVSQFLQERLTSLREKLTASETALQAYRENKGIVNLAGSAQTMAGKQVGDTSERVTQARSRRLELESSYQQLKALKSAEAETVPAVARDPAVAEAVRGRNDVRRRLAEAAETLGTQHPKVRQLETELSQLNATLDQVRSVAAATLTREYEAARTTELSMERELSSARGEVRSVNREEFQLAVLEREVQTNRELYNMFMSRAKETNLASDVQAGVARIADPAVPSSIPFKPNRTQLVVVAAVLALFMGAMASLLLDRLDNTVKGGEDAEVRLHQPLLAALPAVAQLDRKGMARLFLEDGDSHFAEAIRTARTGVMLSSLDTPHKILLITSSLPGEGKTTVAVNMALAHAQTKRTLLIDCDMRRSQVSRSLGVLPNSMGLTNLVQGGQLAQDCMSLVPGSKLMVMPVGDMPPNPLELLLSQRFKDTLKALSEDFEMVIIDSPPVELVSEALVLAPLATSTAFVVKAMSTPAPLVRKSLARLQRAGANIVGVVVNQLNFKDASAYYGEYGHYGYSYGGYGNKASLEDDSKPTVTRVDGAKPA